MSISQCSEWLGIDLGTTNTVVAVYKGNNQESADSGYVEAIYMMESQGTLMDSVIYYEKDSDLVMVGKQAAKMKADHPENTICDSKRIMGLACNHESVCKFQQKMKQYKLVNSDNFAAYEFYHNYKKIHKTPIQVATELLKKIRKSAIEWANDKIEFKRAIITVPFKFGQKALRGTMEAARKAGFLQVKLLCEPSAAAYFYGFKHLHLDGFKILVLDFGGGTLDVSILKVENREFDVQATKGKKWLGGRDFDDKIRTEMIKRIEGQFNYDCTHCQECRPKCNPNECHRAKRMMQILLERCEQLKISLSTMPKTYISLDFIGKHGQVYLTREEYEHLINDELNEVIETVNEAMMDAKLDADGIDEVQMTGGSSSTPILAKLLEDIGFVREKIKMLEPMHAVAKGAAIYGAQQDEKIKDQMPNMAVHEICLLSIGIKICDNIFQPLIRRGKRIPHCARANFATTENDQASMTFEVYEGERKLASENNFITLFTINNLSKGAAGSVLIKLNLSIDENGIMRGWAEHKNSLAMMNVDYKEKRINAEEVEQNIENAKLHKKTDLKEENRLRKKSDLCHVIKAAKYKCKNARMLELCSEYEDWLAKNEKASSKQLDSAYLHFVDESENLRSSNKTKQQIPCKKTIKKKKEKKIVII